MVKERFFVPGGDPTRVLFNALLLGYAGFLHRTAFLSRLGIVDPGKQSRRGFRSACRGKGGAASCFFLFTPRAFSLNLRKRLVGAKLLDFDMMILPIDLARDGRFSAPAGKDQALHSLLRQLAQSAHGAGRPEIILMGETLVEAKRRFLILIKQIDVGEPQGDISKIARAARQKLGGIAVALFTGKIEEKILTDPELSVLSVGHRTHQTTGVRREARRDLAPQILFCAGNGGIRQIQGVFQFACRPDPITHNFDFFTDLDRIGRPLPEPGDLVLKIEASAFEILFCFVPLPDPLQQFLKGHLAECVLQFGRQQPPDLFLVLTRQFAAHSVEFGGERLFALGKIRFGGEDRVYLRDHPVDLCADPGLGQRTPPPCEGRGEGGIGRQICLFGPVDHVLRVAKRLFTIGDLRAPFGVSGKEGGKRGGRFKSVFARKRARAHGPSPEDQSEHAARDDKPHRRNDEERRGGFPPDHRAENGQTDGESESKDHQKQSRQRAAPRRPYLAGNRLVSAVPVDPMEQFFLFPFAFDLFFLLFPFLRRRAVSVIGVRRHTAVDGYLGTIGGVGQKPVSGVFHPELGFLCVKQAFLLLERMQFIERIQQSDRAETVFPFLQFGDFLIDFFALFPILDQFAFAVQQSLGDLDGALFLGK